jgi:hypothetical protein
MLMLRKRNRPESQRSDCSGAGQPYPHADGRRQSGHRVSWDVPLEVVQRAIEELRCRDPGTLLPQGVSSQALAGLKFSDCLPQRLAVHVLAMRSQSPLDIAQVLRAPIRLVSG